MSPRPLLIDSHIFIWMAFEAERLNRRVSEILATTAETYVSDVTLLELAIKFASGKSRFPYSPKELLAAIDALELRRLTLTDNHLLHLADTILPHKDPFDALLVTQSEAGGFTFVTADNDILQTEYDLLDARK